MSWDLVVLETEKKKDDGEGSKVGDEYEVPGDEVCAVAVGNGERFRGRNL